MEANEQLQLREKLATELPHFTGTENWHRLNYPWLHRQILLTDGTKYLADTAKCYWLFDLIASHFAHRRVMAEPFQVWVMHINLEQRNGDIVADDGNGKLIASQSIPYTDFPLDELRLYVTNDDFNGIVVMLPSEY